MYRKCAFTICTNSYIGISRTSRDSFLKYHEDYDYYILVADYVESNDEYIIDADSVLSNYVSNDNLLDMKFKYDLTEYCTSIKPYSILHFFSEYDKVIYLDPDILFYSRLEEIDREEFNVFVTPHSIELSDNIENNESYLRCGIFNCGFIGFKTSERVNSFLRWWGKMLESECFDDSKKGIYTDQKWIDFAPAYFNKNELNIIKNIGYNVAPWNFGERKIIRIRDNFFIVPRGNSEESEKLPLCFIHFSGFNYRELMNKSIKHNFRTFHIYPDIEPFLFDYGKALMEHDALDTLNMKYKYNYFEDNKQILPFHRRLYAAVSDTIGDSPFKVDGHFYSKLKKHRLLLKENMVGNTSVSGNSEDEDKYSSALIRMYKIMFKILGIKRYVKLLKGLKLYSREEKQKWIIKVK